VISCEIRQVFQLCGFHEGSEEEMRRRLLVLLGGAELAAGGMDLPGLDSWVRDSFVGKVGLIIVLGGWTGGGRAGTQGRW
jgi:hypothetical protein